MSYFYPWMTKNFHSCLINFLTKINILAHQHFPVFIILKKEIGLLYFVKDAHFNQSAASRDPVAFKGFIRPDVVVHHKKFSIGSSLIDQWLSGQRTARVRSGYHIFVLFQKTAQSIWRKNIIVLHKKI